MSSRYFVASTYPSVALVIDKFGCRPDNWSGVTCPNATQVLQNFIAADPFAGSLCSESSSCSGDSLADALDESPRAVQSARRQSNAECTDSESLPASGATDDTFFTPLSDAHPPAIASPSHSHLQPEHSGGQDLHPVADATSETPFGHSPENQTGGDLNTGKDDLLREPGGDAAEPLRAEAGQVEVRPRQEGDASDATILMVDVGRDEPDSADSASSSCLIEPCEAGETALTHPEARTHLFHKAVTLVPRALNPAKYSRSRTGGSSSEGHDVTPSNRTSSNGKTSEGSKHFVSLRPSSARRNGSAPRSPSPSNSNSRKIMIVKGTETL